jgi:serine O-acetyltransferase
VSVVGLILSDLRAKAAWCYEAEGPASLLRVLLSDGTLAMILYRLMQASRRWHLRPLEMLLGRLNSILCDCIIGRGAEFGPRFVLIHAAGVVINGRVVGGSGIHLEHQVTIGAERRVSPRLGDDVFVGAGAKILGAVKVGDGARIGANAVVTHDVPPHTTVVGVPARVVRRRSPGEGEPGGA